MFSYLPGLLQAPTLPWSTLPAYNRDEVKHLSSRPLGTLRLSRFVTPHRRTQNARPGLFRPDRDTFRTLDRASHQVF